MSRLLHAAARGARVQGHICGKWMVTRGICPNVDRIHPEDAHLQYGPISSALREFAETGKEPYTVSGYAAMQIFRYECWYPFVLQSEWPHAQMFALILAEALADEGL